MKVKKRKFYMRSRVNGEKDSNALEEKERIKRERKRV